MMQSQRSVLLAVLAAMLLAAATGRAATPPRDLMSDTWVATDALGRALPGDADCGSPKVNRAVGIFYFLWLGQHGTDGPHVVSEIVKHPKGERPWGPVGRFHHWAEPELGFYVSTDEYVIRKHATMLANAGVDVLFFDVTNAFTYDKVLDVLGRTFCQMRAEGNATPQIAFLTNSHHDKVVNHLYTDFYKKRRFRELWFYWQGKPLILSRHDGLGKDVLAFFTFRRSWAWSAAPWFGDGHHCWPWLDHTPQKGGWHEEGKMEMIPVAVAQHPVSNIGRSHQGKVQPPAEKQRPELGTYFAEQARRALEVAPPFVFVTGWNEWVAQRFIAKQGRPYIGGRIEAGDTYFVDQYSQEYSRDMEPMAGGHTDNYYYQLVDFVRRYKGVRPIPKASPPRMMLVDGHFESWRETAPEYRDAAFDTAHRDHAGWGSAGQLTDKTGRNDFVALKVANDLGKVYFYAQTRDPITPSTDAHWMELYIDADADAKTGWEGYDFVVNRRVLNAARTSLHRLAATAPPKLVATVAYAVKGNELELAVPREALGLEGKQAFVLDFHWADNIQKEGDTLEFATHGDSAPDRRFNYRFVRE